MPHRLPKGVNWTFTRLVLDGEVPSPEFRPPLGARAPLPLLRTAHDMAHECGVSFDAFVEAALVKYLAGDADPRIDPIRAEPPARRRRTVPEREGRKTAR